MNFKSKMPTTISVRRFLSLDEYKQVTYDTPIIARARVMLDEAVQSTEGGTEIALTTTIYTQLNIKSADLIWFSGEDTNNLDLGKKWKRKNHSLSLDASQDLYKYDLE